MSGSALIARENCSHDKFTIIKMYNLSKTNLKLHLLEALYPLAQHGVLSGSVPLYDEMNGSSFSRNMNIGGIVFPLEEQSRDQESVVYHGKYDTEGVPHTKSGDRQPVQVSIEVRQQLISAWFSCLSVTLT